MDVLSGTKIVKCMGMIQVLDDKTRKYNISAKVIAQLVNEFIFEIQDNELVAPEHWMTEGAYHESEYPRDEESENVEGL